MTSLPSPCDHYRSACSHLEIASQASSPEKFDFHLGQATVHATLATVAWGVFTQAHDSEPSNPAPPPENVPAISRPAWATRKGAVVLDKNDWVWQCNGLAWVRAGWTIPWPYSGLLDAYGPLRLIRDPGAQS